MMRAILKRDYGKQQTTGEIQCYSGSELILTLKTLELPWKDNQNNISCIPEGDYWLQPRVSEKYGEHLHILNPDGSEILPRRLCLIHPANFVRQLRGCIAVGKTKADIDGDGLADVASSRIAMKEMLKLLPNGGYLSIRKK